MKKQKKKTETPIIFAFYPKKKTQLFSFFFFLNFQNFAKLFVKEKEETKMLKKLTKIIV